MGTFSYRDLKVWQAALDFAEACYCATRTFPKEEQFGITNQIRRASASVAANISEGNARSSTRDYLHHLSIASGSLAEVETFLILSRRVGFLSEATLSSLQSLLDEIGRMLTGLRRALKAKLTPRKEEGSGGRG